MRKLFSVGALVIVASFALAGCGSDGTNQQAEPAPQVVTLHVTAQAGKHVQQDAVFDADVVCADGAMHQKLPVGEEVDIAFPSTQCQLSISDPSEQYTFDYTGGHFADSHPYDSLSLDTDEIHTVGVVIPNDIDWAEHGSDITLGFKVKQ